MSLQLVLPYVLWSCSRVNQTNNNGFLKSLRPFQDWEFTATDNGWTTEKTAVEWLKKIFIPLSTPSRPKEKRLLILDGHGSHKTTDFMYLCFHHDIHLLYFPPHTSHMLQPLDLSVFSSLKRTYPKELGFLNTMTDSSPIGK
jgi:hypothetical protein